MAKPQITNDSAYQLLRAQRISDFNTQKASLDLSKLRGCDFRGLDLRNLDADGLDLTDCYFRLTDLRGIDFRNTILEGASFAEARISGCYFPASLNSDEIRLSVQFGTRLRCGK